MAVLINGIDGSYSVPHVLSTKYKFEAFEQPLKMNVTTAGSSEEKSIDVKATLNGAFKFIASKAATYKPCNDYFRTLGMKLSLKDVLDKGNLTLHCLAPKEGYSYEDLPAANTAGRDIGIHPELLLENPPVLACTLIHELAHVAGATTNTRDKNAGSAELALKSCQCSKQYQPDNLGLMLRHTSSRIA